MLKQILLSLATLFALSCFAQEIPLGSCGLLCTYDAAGNRTSREYFCNIGGITAKEGDKPTPDALSTFEEVDALYPNPTTGKFTISFSKPLDNAEVKIVDMSGRQVTQLKASGSRIDMSLSGQPSGIFFIVIRAGGQIINKKVVKQ